MESVSSIPDRGFEFTTQPRQPDGRRLVIRVSKAGGGTVGRAYEGRWLYRVKRAGERRILAEGSDLNTGAPKTHREAALLVEDFIHDTLGGDEHADCP